MARPVIALVYLAWAPLGTEPVRRFLEALDAHPPGTDHRLVVVLKGFADDAARAGHRALLADRDADEVLVDRREYDLATYMEVGRARPEPVLAFCNTAARPLVGGWLRILQDALERPGVGAVGATASFESALSSAPRPLKPFKAPLFPPFPNAHLRTNAFALRRELLDRLRWGRARTKTGALMLESGRSGLTRQVQALGLEVLVAGRDGRADPPDAWPGSRTFRSGDQERLLVADNRTDQFRDAGPQERRELARMAWGPHAQVR